MGELIFWFPIALCGIAMAFDLRTREIPDTISIVLVVASVLALVGSMVPPAWHSRLLGGLIALLLGTVLARRDGFGGGDVKLFAALGCWFGVGSLFALAIWTALAGLPLAMIALARKQPDFAYAPAIFTGVCVHSFFPDLLQRIAS